jgi:glycosyltransferase involved in cell wall biosynthesis
MNSLSVVIITLNEERNLPRCLLSVKDIAAEVIVVDSGSTDATVKIATESGCRVFKREMDGYGQQKQFGVDQASNDWILSLDADEELTAEAAGEIKTLLDHGPDKNGYFLPFRLVFLGKVLKYGGTGHEKKIRFYNRNHGKFTFSAVHEKVEVEGPVGILNNVTYHYSYSSIDHHVRKSNRYTTQAAEGNLRNGKHYPKIWVALKFPVSFITFYFLKGSILDGYPGFMWAFMAAVYGSLKIAKTIELTEKSK